MVLGIYICYLLSFMYSLLKTKIFIIEIILIVVCFLMIILSQTENRYKNCITINYILFLTLKESIFIYIKIFKSKVYFLDKSNECSISFQYSYKILIFDSVQFI